MANQQRTAGFMEQLGLLQQQNDRRTGGSDPFSSRVNATRSSGQGPLSQLIAGAASGIAGQIKPGEEKRGIGKFGRDFNAGIQDLQDGFTAREQGIPVDMVRTRRALAEKLQTIDQGEGTLQDQIRVATQTARMANQMGDIDTAMKANAIKNQLKTQLDQQKKAGVEQESRELELAEDEAEASIGKEASLVTDDDAADPGKAIRIDSERAAEMGLGPESIGKWLYIGADGTQQVVDGVQLRLHDDSLDKFGVGTIARKDDNIIALAKHNGATSGNIPKLRATLNDMKTQGSIVTEVAELMLNMTDPEFILDLTGKTAIQVNRWVRFGENAAQLVASADGQGGDRLESKYTWESEGKVVNTGSAAAQHQQFINRGKDEGFLVNTLNKLSKEAGLPGGSGLADFLPTQIADKLSEMGASTETVARVAEQYWANVMELAYMDAKLKEPSNRGLSDKDIENALRRIGAATANPASFAQRQLSLIRRVGDAIDHLGGDFTVPFGARTRVEDVVNFVYNPESRKEARRSTLIAEAKMQELFDQQAIESGVQKTQPTPSSPNAPVPQLSPEDFEGFNDLSPEDQAEFRRLYQQGNQ